MSASVIWHTMGIEPRSRNSHSTLITIRPRTHKSLFLSISKNKLLCEEDYKILKSGVVERTVFFFVFSFKFVGHLFIMFHFVFNLNKDKKLFFEYNRKKSYYSQNVMSVRIKLFANVF